MSQERIIIKITLVLALYVKNDILITFFNILYKKKTFYFQFLSDLDILRCPKDDFTFFTKCLLVCMSAGHKFCGRAGTKTNECNFIEFYI